MAAWAVNDVLKGGGLDQFRPCATLCTKTMRALSKPQHAGLLEPHLQTSTENPLSQNYKRLCGCQVAPAVKTNTRGGAGGYNP